jgi:hypothetical protein
MTLLLMVTFQTAGKIQNWGISTKLGRLGVWFEVVTVHCRASFGFVFSTTHPTHMLIGAWDFHLDFGPPAATSWGYADLPPLGFTWHVAVVGKKTRGKAMKGTWRPQMINCWRLGWSWGGNPDRLLQTTNPPRHPGKLTSRSIRQKSSEPRAINETETTTWVMVKHQMIIIIIEVLYHNFKYNWKVVQYIFVHSAIVAHHLTRAIQPLPSSFSLLPTRQSWQTATERDSRFLKTSIIQESSWNASYPTSIYEVQPP